jgi:phage-related protein
MPSVTSSITDLIGSIISVITSAISGVLGLFQHLFSTIFGIIQTLFAAVGTSIAGLAQTFEGLLKFLLSEYHYSITGVQNAYVDIGNILVIGLVLAALFLYSMYQQRGGKPISAKKTA